MTPAIEALLTQIKALPTTQQITLIQQVVEKPDFADFDQDDLDKLDDALASLSRQSVAADRKQAQRGYPREAWEIGE